MLPDAHLSIASRTAASIIHEHAMPWVIPASKNKVKATATHVPRCDRWDLDRISPKVSRIFRFDKTGTNEILRGARLPESPKFYVVTWNTICDPLISAFVNIMSVHWKFVCSQRKHLLSAPAFILTALLFISALNGVSGSDAISPDDTWMRVLKSGQDALATGNRDNYDVKSGSFTISSDMIGEASLTCYYSTPLAKNGKQPQQAFCPIYFFHTPNPGKGNILDNAICERFVKELGATVFGIAFNESSKMGLFFGNQAERQKFYVFSKSGAFHSILTAWSVLRSQFSILTRRFLLYGYSAGGIGVQRFAEEFPEYCAGIVTVNGHTFTQKYKSSCPILVIHSYGDGGCAAGHGLWNYYSSLSTPCDRVMLSPGWERLKEGDDFAFHAVNGEVSNLSVAFFSGVNDAIAHLSQKELNSLPTNSEWPYIAANEDPLIIAANRGSATIQEIKALGLSPMPIPSARFYAEFLKSPLPPLNVKINSASGFLMRPSPTRPALGVVTLMHNEANLDQAENLGFNDRIFVDGQYLAEKGFAVLLANTPADADQISRSRKMQPASQSPSKRFSLLIDPPLEFLDAMKEGNCIAITFTRLADLPKYFTKFETLMHSHSQIIVLLPCHTKQEYDAAVSQINPLVRSQLFPAFDLSGNDLGLSIRQQQIEAAEQFFESSMGIRKK